jgi:predicted transcriptional regulator
MPPDETAQFLAGSADRRRLLAHLADQPGTPAELADALSVARRSIQRHLGTFVDRGWAEKAGGEYRLTTVGELVVDEHTGYLETLDRIETFRPFFEALPDRTHAPDPAWVDTATLVAASAANPQAPVRAYLDGVRALDTDRVRMLSPILSRAFHDAHAELARDGVDTELVMDETTIRRARELNPAEFEVVVALDVLDLYCHPAEIRFGLTLGDETVLMGAYDEEGNLRACVTSSDADFHQWGERLFERYLDAAEPVDSALPFG